MAETTHFAGKLILKYDTSPAAFEPNVLRFGQKRLDAARPLRCHRWNPPDPGRRFGEAE